MKKIAFLSSAVLLAFCFYAPAILGQETTGTIEGVVKDSSGAAVPNVTLTITTAKNAATGTTTTGTGTGFKRTITANEEGFFRLLQVPPGTYDIVTTASGGFGEARYENVTVAIGQSSQLEITVNPDSTVNTVDVSVSDAPPVDTTNNAIQTTINAQKIELLPKGTGFTSLLKTVPGTRPESRSGGFSVDGASGGENVFVIDGQEVTNYRTGTLNETYNIPTQLIQEVQVKSSGFNAEYGGATGGVVSVVTRGGTNDLHGEFGIQFGVPNFNGNPRPVLNRLTAGTVGSGTFTQKAEYYYPQKARGIDYFPTANLSGRIIKDRLWFHTSYSPQFFNTEVDTQYYRQISGTTNLELNTVETYTRNRRYEYAFARLDASPFDKLRLTGTFLWNPLIDEGLLPFSTFSNVPTTAITVGNVPTANFGGSIGTLRGNEFTSQQGGRQNSNLVTFAGVYTPTSSLVFDGRYSRGFLNEKLGNYFVPTSVQIFSCGTPNVNFPCSTTGANTITTKDVSVRESFEFSGAYLFSAGGRHELKGGFQRYTIFNDVQSGNNAIGRISFNYGTPISTLQPGVMDTPGAVGSASFRRTGTNGQGSNLSQGNIYPG